ncbi:MAG: hypothetical protein L3J03_02945 [Desulfobacterales bacterium]|nr:hypothetical protein [Desulfobacterales bacterium]
MASESPLRRSEFLLDSLFMNSRPFSMERPLVEENPFPDRRGVLNVYIFFWLFFVHHLITGLPAGYEQGGQMDK